MSIIRWLDKQIMVYLHNDDEIKRMKYYVTAGMDNIFKICWVKEAKEQQTYYDSIRTKF